MLDNATYFQIFLLSVSRALSVPRALAPSDKPSVSCFVPHAPWSPGTRPCARGVATPAGSLATSPFGLLVPLAFLLRALGVGLPLQAHPSPRSRRLWRRHSRHRYFHSLGSFFPFRLVSYQYSTLLHALQPTSIYFCPPPLRALSHPGALAFRDKPSVRHFFPLTPWSLGARLIARRVATPAGFQSPSLLARFHQCLVVCEHLLAGQASPSGCWVAVHRTSAIRVLVTLCAFCVHFVSFRLVGLLV